MRSFLAGVISQVIFVLLGNVAVGQQQPEASPVIEFSTDADSIVVQMTSFSGNSGSSEIPILRVYGDGRVLIYRAKRPTEQRYYEFRLSRDELDRLLRYLYDHNAMLYDYGVVEQRVKEDIERRRSAARGDRIDYAPSGLPSDGTTTIIEVFLKTFKPGGSESLPQNNFYHRSGGYATTVVARNRPELKEAQDLTKVIERLSELIRDSRRQLVPPASYPPEDQQ